MSIVTLLRAIEIAISTRLAKVTIIIAPLNDRNHDLATTKSEGITNKIGGARGVNIVIITGIGRPSYKSTGRIGVRRGN